MSGGLFLRHIAVSSYKNRLKYPRPASINPFSGSLREFSVSSCVNMKLLQFKSRTTPSEIRVGYLTGECVVDVNQADPSLPHTLIEILRQGLMDKVKSLTSTERPSIPLSEVSLLSPITGMDKVLCVGLNYKDHCAEQHLTPPAVPMIFNKFPSTVVGASEPVKLRTDVTKKVDWEVELAVVIGRAGSRVRAAQALALVAGYTVAQDVSARDWQKEKNMGQFLLGKSMDSFCPLGPWMTTADEIPDPHELKISCALNGVCKQRSTTDQLIHRIPEVIERLTSVMTLLPGDVILTGTPGGVGMYLQPPEFLQPGDVLLSEVQGIGTLETLIQEYHHE